MKCRMPSCPGHYECKKIVHHEPFEGHIAFIDGVPADVCNVCADTLFPPETAKRLEEWRDDLEEGKAEPADQTELYHFDKQPAQAA